MQPLIVEVRRGQFIESQHTVHAVVVDNTGKILESFGEPSLRVFPRSSIKSIQAMPLILTGMAQGFQISDQEIALASASHAGEAPHTVLVEAWLKRMNLGVSDLECGTHAPYNSEASYNVIREGKSFCALHNNCSGKHSGMLGTAVFMNEPTKAYVKYDHPVQNRIRKLLEEFYHYRLSDYAIDGCSIPTHLVPLQNLAQGLALLAAPDQLEQNMQEAARKIYQACVRNPFFIAGTDMYCTKIIQHLEGEALVKVGAEGVMVAAIPKLKCAVAVKSLDGSARAAEAATSYLLKHLGLFKGRDEASFIQIPTYNWVRLPVGSISVRE